MIIGNSG